LRDRVLWIGCAAYAAFFTALGALKYGVHRNLVDFGIFAQTAASAFGCFCNSIEGSHWGVHFSPVLYGVGAAVALVRSPITLIALQAIAGALVAPPIYALVRRHGGDRMAARLAAAVVWLYPPLAGLVFGDFHENGFAPAAVAWTIYTFDAGAIAWSLAGAALTLSTKEDQAIFLGIAGLWGAWRFRGTRRGWAAAGVVVVCVAVLAAFFGFIQPHASPNAAVPWQPQRFYNWSAADLRTLPATLFARAGFLVLALGPLLFLPLRTPWMILAAAPFAEVLLSRQATTYTIGTHYAGAWIGYVLVAFAFALSRFAPERRRAVLWLCVALCAIELAIADPLHPGLNLRHIEARDVALDRLLRVLPSGVSMATQEEAYTHVALSDPFARLLPEDPQRPIRACFVLVDHDFPNSARLEEYGARFSLLLAQGRYVEAARSGGATLYRRANRCI